MVVKSAVHTLATHWCFEIQEKVEDKEGNVGECEDMVKPLVKVVALFFWPTLSCKMALESRLELVSFSPAFREEAERLGNFLRLQKPCG